MGTVLLSSTLDNVSESEFDIEKTSIDVDSEPTSPADSATTLCNVVSWDGDWDPANPQNWSKKRKWAATLIISAFAFIGSVSSSILAPALARVAEEFSIGSMVEQQLVLSVFLLGYIFGPILSSPLSETWGRLYVTQVANGSYAIFNLACGFAQNSTQLMVFRALAGVGASSTLGIGSGTIRDVWRAHERGLGLSFYSLCTMLGPAVGPLCEYCGLLSTCRLIPNVAVLVGAFIAQYAKDSIGGWRWVFWAVTPVNVLIHGTAFVLMRETYAPVILRRKAEKLRRKTGNGTIQGPNDDSEQSLALRIRIALVRPLRLLATQPIVQVLAVWQAYNYGLLYMFISSFPDLWTNRYGMSLSIGGLNHLAIAIGFIAATQVIAPFNDKIYSYCKKRFERDGVPEYRIPLMVVGATLTPIGLFWYGWAAQSKAFWLLPDIGVVIYAFGSLVSYQCIQVYLVDAYSTYAASAAAATALLRSLAAFSFSFFAPYLYQALDYGWGGSLMGLLAIGIGWPAPLLFWMYGACLRRRSTFAKD
ncbi:MAG: hypothetical protein M1831_000494 [Alyxoria varia]|nr:MAG: hypothetical protein M1831_000494 [Alyxoria varia]